MAAETLREYLPNKNQKIISENTIPPIILGVFEVGVTQGNWYSMSLFYIF